MIACGPAHSLFIDPEGLVWSSGRNHQGQLGLGSLQDQHSFCQIQGVPSAVQVSAAVDGDHSAILDRQGNVYMFGRNDKSQIGEEQTMIVIPTKVQDLPQIIMVSCGSEHTIMLDIKGCLWGAGKNKYGQLSSNGERLKKFTQITSNTTDPMGKVTKISCGHRHSICQNEKGELWSTGHNIYGELGFCHNRNVNRFQKVPLADDVLVQSFHCAIYFSVVLDRDGGVWATGFGACGQLGSGNTQFKCKFTRMLSIPPMAHIICGGYSIFMMDRNGEVYACGSNEHAPLGVGDDKNILSPKAVPGLPKIAQGSITYYFSLVADEEGAIWASGSNEHGQHGNNKCYRVTNRFVHIEGMRANIMNEKRFFSTKRAHNK